MTVLNQHDSFKSTCRYLKRKKQLYPAQTLTSTTPLVSWGGGGRGQHKVIVYVVILLHVYGERKGSLPGYKLVKPGHYLENSLICMIFPSALLTVCFAAHFILCHGMISAQT